MQISAQVLFLQLVPLLIVLCHLLPLSSAAIAFPSLSSPSPHPPPVTDNDLFDPSRVPLTNDRSLFPGVHVLPQAQAVQGFAGQGIGPGGMDLETWSKSQAVKLNQQNAVVSQLAQMAPHRRNQLARDMANGNSTAANELVARLMRDLSATQHGMMAFPHLALMADPQLQTMPTDPAMWAAMRTSPTGFSNLSPAASASPALQAELPQSLRLQMAQQRQILLNGGGLPPMANVFQPGTAFNAPGTFGQSNLGQFGFSSPFRSDRLQNLNSAQIPRNPFVSNGGDLSDVSRPNSLFTPSSPSGGTQTQITPFSQSFLSSNSAKSGVNNELERTLSDAAGVGRSASTGRESFRDIGSLSNGKGFVDDVTMDDTFGRRTAAAGAHQREETKKTFRRWTGN